MVKKYGREAFEITDNHIKVTIPFDEEVLQSMANVGNLVGNSVGNSVGNDEVLNSIISILLENDKASANTIAIKLNISKRTIERALAELKRKGIIEKIDGTRGRWVVKK